MDAPTCHRKSSLDVLAGAISVLCAVHCLILPIALPLVASFVANPIIEFVLLISAAGFGGFALRHGFRMHRFRLPTLFFALGMASLLIGNWVLTGFAPSHFHSPLEVVLVAVGGALLVAAHTTNFVMESRIRRQLTATRKSA